MKIAFDHQIFMLQSYGGISRYFTCLAQGLHDLQQNIQIFAALHRNSYLPLLPGSVVNGHNLEKYPAKTARLFYALNHLFATHQISKWHPDLVHETYYSRLSTTPKGCKTIVTVHDMIHELFPGDFLQSDNTRKKKQKAIERSDHVICVSENTKFDLICLYGIDVNKITVIHLGFDQLAHFNTDARVSPSFNKPYILYVGNRDGYKNFLAFVKSFASSKHLCHDFDIVAFGGGKFTPDELKNIQTLGVNHQKVRHVGGDDHLLGQYYQYASAFIYPSLYEGFGIPPLEAMAHGCPVISSHTSSMPEVIGQAAEFFDPRQTESMCLAIENVVYSETRSSALRQLGAGRLNAFSWKKCTEKTLAVYRSVSQTSGC
jgi:glycosyltransferase involved in cell wall biosynthesis